MFQISALAKYTHFHENITVKIWLKKLGVGKMCVWGGGGGEGGSVYQLSPWTNYGADEM